MKRKKTQSASWSLVLLCLIAFYVWKQSSSTAAPANYHSSYALALDSLANGEEADTQLISHEGYVLLFDRKTNTPRWVAWQLDAEETEGDVSRSEYEFVPDEALPGAHQVTTYDYRGSGFDRGHMCPAADMKWSEQAMYDCHYMSNICPQVSKLNQVYWERLESSCRRWASQEGSLYIVCGPVYSKKRKQWIGEDHRVAVPDAFFKVVLSLNKETAKGIGFYYTNSESQQTMESAARTIDEIETITGLDFFSELPDDQEQVLEAMNDLRSWD